MPAHNAEATITLAISSILRQSLKDLELIIIDDGSTDSTAAIVKQLCKRDSRIVLHSKTNEGIVRALNEGWAMCRGRYVARMDADDFSLPWRLSRQTALLEAAPDIGACGTAVLPFRRWPIPAGAPQRMPASDRGVRTRLLFNPPIMHPTALLRRSLIGEREPYSDEYPHAEDYALWTVLAQRARLANDSRVGLLYRKSSTSVSSRHSNIQAESAARLRYENLIRAAGSSFATRHHMLHEELMARRAADVSLMCALPAYVSALSELPAIDSAVVADHWFGYCLALAQRGNRVASTLYSEVQKGHSRLRLSLLRLVASFPRG